MHRAVAGWLVVAMALVPALAAVDAKFDDHHFCPEHDTIEHDTIDHGTIDHETIDHGGLERGAGGQVANTEDHPAASDAGDVGLAGHETCPIVNVFHRNDAPPPAAVESAPAPTVAPADRLIAGQLDVPPIPLLCTAPKLPPPSAV